MHVEEIVPHVWRLGTRYVNSYVVDAGDAGLVLIDAGLPGYRRKMHAALQEIGRGPEDVAAVVLTHGHSDHVGLADEFADDARVFLHPADIALARNPRLNRTDTSTLRYLFWPATFAFVAHSLANGALKPPRLADPLPLQDGQDLDVPGHPTVVHTPGHTDGSVVIEFPEHDVVFAGDSLCTVSPVTGRPAPPQLQTRGSNRDSDEALRSLKRLEDVTARTVLPGHGGPWHDGIEAAVDAAHRVGCR